MFLDYYKLTEQPFGVTPDSRFLYLGSKHREAMASLIYGTETNRGFLALIAKPGMGKTSLLYQYLDYWRDRARTAFVFRTDCDSRDFIRHVLLDLGVDVSGMNLPAMHDTLNGLLTQEMRAGRRFVLVIDEAQNLEEKVLESVRLLSNFETPWLKLMQIVLAGQPQLADRLASPSMTQLRQRISMVIRLEPLDYEEVNAYINHRLWMAGCEEPATFTVGARRLIAEHSEGIPRNINNLCFNAMSLGFALRRKTIDRDIILNVIADLDLEPLRDRNRAENVEKRSPELQTVPPRLSGSERKPSTLGRRLAKLALAGALVASLEWLAVQVNRDEPRVIAAPATSQVSASSSVVSTSSAEEPAVAVAQAPEEIRVNPGETLREISIQTFGKYDDEVLAKIRQLNPRLTDPNLIRAGQKILVSSATTVPNQARRAAEPSSALTAEAGKQ
jgi:type II secretory pathway predicted ATPase ExeA